jgi:hypothetical protein
VGGGGGVGMLDRDTLIDTGEIERKIEADR